MMVIYVGTAQGCTMQPQKCLFLVICLDFKQAWFEEWPWLSYNEMDGSVIHMYVSTAYAQSLFIKRRALT